LPKQRKVQRQQMSWLWVVVRLLKLQSLIYMLKQVFLRYHQGILLQVMFHR